MYIKGRVRAETRGGDRNRYNPAATQAGNTVTIEAMRTKEISWQA